MSRASMRNVEARRMREDALKLQEANVRDMQKATSTALWEDNTMQKQRVKDIQNKQMNMNAQHNDTILEKKNRLADLYNQEMQMWRNEMNQLRTSTDNKQQTMMDRARALKEKRLREKRQIVEEKLLQQQRDACDDARVADTLKKDREIFELRKHQLTEKEQKLAEQKAYDAKMAGLWADSKRSKDEQEAEKERQAKQRNEEMKTMLDQQVSYRSTRQQDNRVERERDIEQLKNVWAVEERKAQEKEDIAMQATMKRAAEVSNENTMQQQQIQSKKQQERDHDQRLLEMAMEREKMQEQAEQDLKDAQKREMREYQTLLQQQMAIEAEDQSTVEGLLRQEEARIRGIEDLKQQREQAARDSLRAMVMQTRKEQEDHKLKLKHDAKSLDRVEASKLNAQLDALTLEEKSIAMKSALERKNYQKEINSQMDKKSQDQQFQKQQAFLQHKHSLHAQRNYEESLQKLVEMPPQQQFKRKSAVWQFDS